MTVVFSLAALALALALALAAFFPAVALERAAVLAPPVIVTITGRLVRTHGRSQCCDLLDHLGPFDEPLDDGLPVFDVAGRGRLHPLDDLGKRSWQERVHRLVEHLSVDTGDHCWRCLIHKLAHLGCKLQDLRLRAACFLLPLHVLLELLQEVADTIRAKASDETSQPSDIVIHPRSDHIRSGGRRIDVCRVGGLQAVQSERAPNTRSQATSEKGLGFREVRIRIICIQCISRPLSDFRWRLQLGGGEDGKLLRNQDGGQCTMPPCLRHHEASFSE